MSSDEIIIVIEGDEGGWSRGISTPTPSRLRLPLPYSPLLVTGCPFALAAHIPYSLGKLRGRTGIFPSSYAQPTTRPALECDLISVEEVCSLVFNNVSV
jgi:hypothetical protein